MKSPRVGAVGLRNNRQFWAHQVRTVWIPDLLVFREVVMDRALTLFDNLERESEEASDAVWARSGARPGSLPDFTDLADYAEAAIEAGVDFYTSRISARQGLLNLFSVGLYHRLEQQLLFLLRRELLPAGSEFDTPRMNLQELERQLALYGIALTNLAGYSRVSDLRLLANTVKHADGSSARALFARRPELFMRPGVWADVRLGDAPDLPTVYSPLAGEDVYVTPEVLDDSFDAAACFLRALADALEGTVPASQLEGESDAPHGRDGRVVQERGHGPT